MPVKKFTLFKGMYSLEWWEGVKTWEKIVNIQLVPGSKIISAILRGIARTDNWFVGIQIRVNGVTKFKYEWSTSGGETEINVDIIDVIQEGTNYFHLDIWKTIWYPRRIDVYVEVYLELEISGEVIIVEQKNIIKYVIVGVLTAPIVIGLIAGLVEKFRRRKKKKEK